ncbi:hypothetical protein F-VV10_0437 [Faustovirus]|nr:hypothetical protein F-VV10_0437 [Faustovirus]
MSSLKINNLIERVQATNVRSKVKSIKTMYKDIKITTDGFADKPIYDDKTNEIIDISKKAKVIVALREIMYIIIALAKGSMRRFVIVNGEQKMAKDGDLVIEYEKNAERPFNIERVNKISWRDVCDCLFDYVEDIKCKVEILADIRLTKMAPPKVKIDIEYHPTHGKFYIEVGGKVSQRFANIQTRFTVNTDSFYVIDHDGEVFKQSTEELDDEMDTWFKSRSNSSQMSRSASNEM